MISFVYRTDTHLMDRNPVSWKGDYQSEVWSNIVQVGQIARQYEAMGVLDGGDYFNLKAASKNPHSIVAETARVHREYPCPTFCVEGNHDMAYNRLDTISGQPLGVLYAAGVFQHLREHVFEDGTRRVRVVGVPYSTLRSVEELRSIQKKPGDTHLVAIVHALAGEDPPANVAEFMNEPVFRYDHLITKDGPDVWCFPPETPVLDWLYRPIPIAQVGGSLAVRGRSGPAVVEVVHPVRQVAEELISLDIEGVPPLVPGATSEHPYWVAKGLRCVLPSRATRRCHPDKSHASYPCTTCIKEPRVYASWVGASQIEAGDYVAIPVPSIPQGAPSQLGLARLLGYYVAEGHIITNRSKGPVAGVAWSFHEDETDLHEDVRLLVKEHFDLDTHPHPGGTGACTQICAYGSEIAKFFTEHGGRYSDKKSLSSWIWQQSATARVEFLIGWMLGDGHARWDKTEVMGATVSQSLAFQIYFLSLSVGLRPYFTVRPPRDDFRQLCNVISFYGDDAASLSHRLGVQPPDRSKTKVAGFFSDGLYYARVRDVGRYSYEGPVHNFSTNTGEYLAGGVLVHNCFGHWHKDQGVVKIGGKTFVNQGALSRGALNHENTNRIPKASVLQFGVGEVNVITVPMNVAPAEDVFDMERKERQETENRNIDQFISMLQTDANFDPSVTIEENVESLVFATDVKRMALDYLDRARLEVG